MDITAATRVIQVWYRCIRSNRIIAVALSADWYLINNYDLEHKMRRYLSTEQLHIIADKAAWYFPKRCALSEIDRRQIRLKHPDDPDFIF